MASLVVTVDDDTTPIIMSAAPGATSLGIVSWTDPAVIKLNEYAPTVRYLDGATSLGWNRQQTLINWTVAPFGAANEAAADALLAALDASISRLGFTISRNKNGVTKVWRCDAGSLTPTGETTRLSLERPNVELWNVSVPCFPVPVS